MLFNSPEFIFVFLPLVLIGTWLLAGFGLRTAAFAWLTVSSFAFYGWFKPVYLILLFLSIGLNYFCGERILRLGQASNGAMAKRWLIGGVIFNLALLGWFKYANFFADTLSATGIATLSLPEILLPIGISFFTFQQIAYLMDCRAGIAHRSGILKYSLFVVYFPQLIAGPIVHPNAILPQFESKDTLGFRMDRFVDGLTIFILGLGKKTILADAFGVWAGEGFNAVAGGESLTILEAWGSVLCYTLQIYFDFSGYSDMAIGLGWMLGIRLPINFHSPYKATSIIEFWRRWHITLSSFLRDYLYFPMGGNRKGPRRRWINLFITMLLGGLWHGAGWTFVLWGAIHGIFLVINHGWMELRSRHTVLNRSFGIPGKIIGWSVTMLAVIFAWVFFRAADLETALRMFRGLGGMSGVALPEELRGSMGFLGEGVNWTQGLPNLASGSRSGLAEVCGFLILGLGIAIFGRPLQEMSLLSRRLLLVPVAALALQKVLVSSAPSEFLYFQF